MCIRCDISRRTLQLSEEVIRRELNPDLADRFVFQYGDACALPFDDGEFDDSGFGYQPGQPSSIVVVRAYYRWHVMTPMFQQVFQNINGGERVLISTMMFRNEPYQ